ncbi:uncharacterized protein YaeQ [Sphingobacterium sp. 2149]|nr:uncharacterized protein YaeQ [Sphingobacterium sp. 2149]
MQFLKFKTVGNSLPTKVYNTQSVKSLEQLKNYSIIRIDDDQYFKVNESVEELIELFNSESLVLELSQYIEKTEIDLEFI